MKRLPITAISLLMLPLCIPLTVSADRTLRGKLRVDKQASTTAPVDTAAVVGFDTIIAPTPESIKLSGYDKPLTSRKESMFATNNLDCNITEIEIKITYMDLNGRTLHERTATVRSDIPKHSTRRIEFPSWDRQQSFYYRHSRKPRTNNVTPYDVRCTVTRCVTVCETPTTKAEK